MRIFGTTSALVLVLLSLGCAKDRPPPASPASSDPGAFNPPASAPEDPSVLAAIRASRDDTRTSTERTPAIGEARPFYGTSTSPGGQILAKTDKPLTDAEILGVAIAANDGEVQVAELAIQRATHPDVRQFAVMMKSHHGSGLQRAHSVEAKTKITGADSDVSNYLKDDVDKLLRSLHPQRGRAFDEAYVDAQVKAHNDVLLAIDNRLTPGATNGEVKSLLVELRKTVSDHLMKAEDLRAKVHEVAATPPRRTGPGLGVAGPKAEPSSPKSKHDVVAPVDPQPRP